MASHSAKTIVVMADTHVRTAKELPRELLTAVKDADYVIHLGDFYSLELLKDLRKHRKFYGVIGNHDDLNLGSELREMEEIEISGKKLGLIHGLIVPVASRRRMKSNFCKNGKSVNAILYGHTHIPTIKKENGILFFNPGSVAGKFPAPIKSFGRLTIDGTIKCEIVTLENHGSNGPLMHIPTVFMRNFIRFVEPWF
jgi:hypothetical protein